MTKKVNLTQVVESDTEGLKQEPIESVFSTPPQTIRKKPLVRGAADSKQHSPLRLWSPMKKVQTRNSVLHQPYAQLLPKNRILCGKCGREFSFSTQGIYICKQTCCVSGLWDLVSIRDLETMEVTLRCKGYKCDQCDQLNSIIIECKSTKMLSGTP